MPASGLRKLRRAYLRAGYRVIGTPPIVLRIKQRCPALESRMQRERCQGAALITAYNPYSRRQSLWRNRRAQQRLIAELDRRGLQHLPAINSDPRRRWPDEKSRLVLGIRQRDAIDLAREFRQNALLWIEADQVVRLIWVNGPSTARG